MRMAIDLGLSSSAHQVGISERGRNQLRATWLSVNQLNTFASTCKLAFLILNKYVIFTALPQVLDNIIIVDIRLHCRP